MSGHEYKKGVAEERTGRKKLSKWNLMYKGEKGVKKGDSLVNFITTH